MDQGDGTLVRASRRAQKRFAGCSVAIARQAREQARGPSPMEDVANTIDDRMRGRRVVLEREPDIADAQAIVSAATEQRLVGVDARSAERALRI